ncbi:MAG: DUF2505 domain-containing protein [Leptospiraceae bacterium]|nr:DUF2505 domain-containing protein [Leptospiraceae bacterium]
MAHTFTLIQSFPAHVDKVLAARERRFEDVSKQEGLKGQQVLDRTTEGSIITTKRAFSLADKIPDAIKPMVPAGFLNLTETARFDTAERINRFEVIYEQNPDRLRISGVTKYIHENEQSSRREYSITVKVNIALIGGMLESQIASSFRKGIEKDFDIIRELLEK